MAYIWYRTGELVERDVFGDITIRYVDKVVTRLHGISFGEEEYVGGFRIASRITIILENDFEAERKDGFFRTNRKRCNFRC